MQIWTLALTALLALACGVAIGRVLGQHREATLREELAVARAAARTEEQLLESYRAMSATAFREQSEALARTSAQHHEGLERAAEARWKTQGEIVVRRLEDYARSLHRLESERRVDTTVLREALNELRSSNEVTRAETARLAGALRDNPVRGAWGEMQLRRVLEEAGMMTHVDFVEQGTHGDALSSGRPDVVVRLPNGRNVVIDAKAPLQKFLEATEAGDPSRRHELLAAHGAALSSHVGALAKRRYTEIVNGSVDFVVLFVPGDAFLSAAFEHRPALLEEAFARNVVLASPGTLLAFLRGVALGWRERSVAEQADQIAQLGRELHDRIATFADHFDKLGTALGRTLGAYNSAVGSLESRLLVTARKFDELGAGSSHEVLRPSTLSTSVRALAAPELVELRDGTDEPPDTNADGPSGQVPPVARR